MGRETRLAGMLWMPVMLIILLLLGRPGLAADVVLPEPVEPNAKPEQAATNGPDEDVQDSPVEISPGAYVPPRWGAPRAKVGGGLRYGPQGTLPVTLTLAPEQVARTASASPTLFWHIDTVPDPGAQLIFYLTDFKLTDPVAEIALASPERPGIQRIDLAEHGVELELGVEYDWAIALVVDPERRSRDIMENAYIQRVAAPPGLSGERCGFESCVELGLWYDALAAISDAIEVAPADAALREQRDQLLRQFGLGAAAEGSAPQAR